jgi:hypothetical protein
MELCGWLPSTEGLSSSGPVLCVDGSDRLSYQIRCPDLSMLR